MSAVVRVTGAWTRLLADWLDAEGLAAPELRAAIGRHADDGIVPLGEWQALLARAVALRPGRPAPGLGIGAGVQPRHLGVLGYLVLSSRNLGEAMLAYQRYERLFYGADLAEVAFEDGDVELRWRRQDALGQLHDETAIAALITFLRRQIDDPPPPTRVTFTNPPPPAAVQAVYENFFGCPVGFADSHTRVRFPAHYLAIPMPHSEPGLRALLDRQAQALLAALPQPDALDRALQQVMLRLFRDGAPSLPRAARELHLAPRTLQRRLDARGLSWQQLLDRTREQLARHYLRDPGLSPGDIALLLGYSEQSAFTRAFRRWTRTTPARWRRTGGAGPD